MENYLRYSVLYIIVLRGGVGSRESGKIYPNNVWRSPSRIISCLLYNKKSAEVLTEKTWSIFDL
ncbi:MAG: hypothetical protein GDA44_13615 [Prochloron sp. SP5CPC1]|nr:hypothetical protein [Candidatus Paraprochloron terpiosi SP5CPC1]